MDLQPEDLFEKMKLLRVFSEGSREDDRESLLPGKEIIEKQCFSFSDSEEILSGFAPDMIICDYAPASPHCQRFCHYVEEMLPERKVFLFFCLPEEFSDIQKKDKELTVSADGVLNKPVGGETVRSLVSLCRTMKKNRYRIDYTEKKLGKAMEYIGRFKKKLSFVRREADEEKQMLHNSLKQIALMTRERETLDREAREGLAGVMENTAHVVELLAELIDGKKSYHRGHSRRVAEISVYMAGEFDLEEDEILEVHRAALLHEVGKLSIPEDLAMKTPDQYLPHEKNLLSQHPVKGASMIGGFKGLEGVARIVGALHEHVDGSGLPSGRKKSRIPLGARIIAVANIFENLMYRSEMDSAAEVFLKIEGETGVKYDAAMMFPLAGYVYENPVGTGGDIEKAGIYELVPGHELASGIYTSGGAKLLPAGSVLTETSIARISEYHKMDPLKEVVFIKK